MSGAMTDGVAVNPFNHFKVVNDNRQALENLKMARLALRNTQPSTVLNSLDMARKAVDLAIGDMEAVVRQGQGGVL